MQVELQVVCQAASLHNSQSRHDGGPWESMSRKTGIIAFLIWGVLVGSWFGYLAWYSNAPGEASAAPMDWPAAVDIELDALQPTVLMFVHPQCPCTRASVDELAKIVARCEERAAFYCVFVCPPGVAKGFEDGALWEKAGIVPHLERIVDADGALARRFGAETSGAVQVYMPSKKLVFNGGITIARSHSGDNVGSDAVTQILTEGRTDRATTFVFGCPLF